MSFLDGSAAELNDIDILTLALADDLPAQDAWLQADKVALDGIRGLEGIDTL